MSKETIADILAEMFDFSDKRIEEGRDHAMTSESVGLIVHQLAKRFEAAWKRESAGNAAAMREALVAVDKAFDDELICTDSQMSMEELDRLDEVYHKVKAALSAPARNCDVIRDVGDALLSYHRAEDKHLYGHVLDWLLNGKAEGGAE